VELVCPCEISIVTIFTRFFTQEISLNTKTLAHVINLKTLSKRRLCIILIRVHSVMLITLG
jgi:hypothetical protein